MLIGQYIEAQNLQHLEYGTSSAKSLMLSFHIKSTKTGTYCLSVTAPDGSRNIIKEYTVSASNTWEKKTIIIPGDTSGTINNDNGQGLWLQWVLIAGTDRHKAADSWSGTTSDIATSNQVNACDSASNNIYLAGVQLEVGTEATPFEHRSFADELTRCQRYFLRIGGTSTYELITFGGMASSSTQVQIGYSFPTFMRAKPSVSFTDLAVADSVNSQISVTDVTSSSNITSEKQAWLNFIVSSGLTQYRPYYVRVNNNATTGGLEFDIEL